MITTPTFDHEMDKICMKIWMKKIKVFIEEWVLERKLSVCDFIVASLEF